MWNFEILYKITKSISHFNTFCLSFQYFFVTLPLKTQKHSMRLTPKTYLHSFAIIVMVVAFLRLTTDIEHFSWTANSTAELADSTAADSTLEIINDSMSEATETEISAPTPEPAKAIADNRVPNRILSVPNYDVAFPDANDVQIIAAQQYGVKPVTNRKDAEMRKTELVFVGANPFFHVDNLRSSIPYLVPRAAELLQDIGRAYYDSLNAKGVPLHKIIATSILRTKEDVERLRRHNPNATENSCHLYGTTIDIAQNRFKTIEDPDGPHRRQVTNDTLKWVLTEVLRDMREQGRCYIKYEKKQGCFHLTVR